MTRTTRPSRILVFGATSAIAQASIRVWAARGDRLVLVGRDSKKLEAVAHDARVRGAERVESLVADLDDTHALDALVARAWDALGGADAALVAHGVLGDQKAGERSYAEAERQLRTNFLSVVALLTPLANRFEAQQTGTLAVLSSVAGDRGRQSNYVYGTAKAAVSVFLQGLRHRLAPAGVAVVTVKPGFVDTPMTAHLKKGPLFASADRVGRGVVRAMDRRAGVVYLPGFWRLIMLVVRNVPDWVFHKTKL